MMEKLTPRQKAFADNYIESGNATEAARKAGYSPNGLNKRVGRMMANDGIKAYIAERTKPTEDKRIATADEVMEFFTSVMRGAINDAFDLPPSLADRKDAAKELAKRTWDVNNKSNTGGGVVIVNNIPRNKSD